jgi:hypothetical protein
MKLSKSTLPTDARTTLLAIYKSDPVHDLEIVRAACAKLRLALKSHIAPSRPFNKNAS